MVILRLSLHSGYDVYIFLFSADKEDLQKYLKDVYDKKLNITLLPKWIELHVSDMFTPLILVDNEPLTTFKDIFCKDVCVKESVNECPKMPIFLLGNAGAGKSTFCKHLTDMWSHPTSTASQFNDASFLERFKFLFYVSFRFATEESSILDMIKNQLFSRKDEAMWSVAKDILLYHPELCLILSDGLDEWRGSATSETSKPEDIKGMPSLVGVSNCVIVITSRPYRFYALSYETRKRCRKLDLNGIKNEAELILKILKGLNDPEPEVSRDIFLCQIKDNNITGLLATPLTLILALDTWKADKILHKTLCMNYVNMIKSFIQRTEGQGGWSAAERRLRRVSYSDITEIEGVYSVNDLPRCFSENRILRRYSCLLLTLGRLACNLLFDKQTLVFTKDVCESFLNDDEDEKLTVCLELGILSKTETTAFGIEIVDSYSFSHKTFQEFFAALWLSIKYSEERLNLYHHIKTRYDLFDHSVLIQFLCGLRPEVGVEFWRYIAEEVIRKDDRSTDERDQNLVLKTVKEASDCCRKQGEQVYFCIPDVWIHKDVSDEEVSLLCKMIENNTSYLKYLVMEKVICLPSCEYHSLCNSISCATELQELNLLSITCPTNDSSSHVPVLNLQKNHGSKILDIDKLSISGLLLPNQKYSQLWYLKLYNLELSHDNIIHLVGSLSSFDGLERIELTNISCSEHSDSCCLPVLDLHKHPKLEELKLGKLSINGLLLFSQKYSSLEDLNLTNLICSHGSLVQLCRSLSSLSSLERLELINLACSEHCNNCRLPVLNLQKHHSLEMLLVDEISISGLLLPSHKESQLKELDLNNLVLSHNSLVQLCSSVSSLSSLAQLKLTNIPCGDHSHSCILPHVDPPNDDLDHKHQSEKSVNDLLSLSGLEDLQITDEPCDEHNSICTFTVLDLHKHDRLRVLKLDAISVSGLLLQNTEESLFEDLSLKNLELSHYSLVHICSSVSTLCGLELLQLANLTCRDHTVSCHLPALDLPEADIDFLDLEEMSLDGLLPSRCSFSTINLTRITMSNKSWVQFITDFVNSSIIYNSVGVKLESCNIDSDTRAFIACCPQFCVKTNNDELVEFELFELGSDSSEDNSSTKDANSK